VRLASLGDIRLSGERRFEPLNSRLPFQPHNVCHGAAVAEVVSQTGKLAKARDKQLLARENITKTSLAASRHNYEQFCQISKLQCATQFRIGQRARINSKINLLREAWKPDQERMQRLQRTAEDLDKRISEHGLGDA
jgi:hypothetical protein